MRGNKKIDGFDYLAGTSVRLTTTQVKQIIRVIVEAGGFRRVENGETFLHDKSGKIVYEFYSNVNVTKSGD